MFNIPPRQVSLGLVPLPMDSGSFSSPLWISSSRGSSQLIESMAAWQGSAGLAGSALSWLSSPTFAMTNSVNSTHSTVQSAWVFQKTSAHPLHQIWQETSTVQSLRCRRRYQVTPRPTETTEDATMTPQRFGFSITQLSTAGIATLQQDFSTFSQLGVRHSLKTKQSCCLEIIKLK